MLKKTGSVSVAVGSYSDDNGAKKTMWEKVGSLLTNGNGGQFISLKRTFNPSGVPLCDNYDNAREILLCVFEDKKGGRY